MLEYAARTNLGTGRQHIVSRHPLENLVASIVAKFSLHGVVNAQFRRAEDGRWLLLEINARPAGGVVYAEQVGCGLIADRSEEHTSELQSLMRISYAVFCLKKKNKKLT